MARQMHSNHFFLRSVQYLNELDDLRTRLSSTRATAEASAASAKSAQQQCLSLLKELNEKDKSLKEHEIGVNKLDEQLDLLQKDLHARELSQRQLKDEVIRIETDIMDAVAKAGSKSDKDNELLKILLSAHWTNKTKELESQVCFIFFLHKTLLIFGTHNVSPH
jgi:chromosome segregation ATPase